MPPEDQNPTTYTELAVAIGRIEEKVSRLADMEERLREVEKTTDRLEARLPQKTPWYFIVSGVVGIITGIGGLIALIAVLARVGGI
jgi:hypothetical protein